MGDSSEVYKLRNELARKQDELTEVNSELILCVVALQNIEKIYQEATKDRVNGSIAVEMRNVAIAAIENIRMKGGA